MKFWKKWRQTILTMFIVFNVIAVVIGCTQIVDIPFAIRKVFYPYLGWTRLAQSWRLFAPEPKRVAIKYRVDVTYQDQSKKSWWRPYPSNWDFFGRHEAYQFQKFDLGSNYLMKDLDARKDFCTYVLRQNLQEGNPAEFVELFQEIAKWPVPTNERPLSYDESQLKFVDHFVARYKVNGTVLE